MQEGGTPAHKRSACTEQQEGSEKFLPARRPGSSAGPWPASTLLTRIPAPFGRPKGHSQLLTAAFCLGNTSGDVLSRASSSDHSPCQATTIDISLQPSGPGWSPREQCRRRQSSNAHSVQLPPTLHPLHPSLQLYPRAGRVAHRTGDTPGGAELPVQLLRFEDLSIPLC